MAYYIIAIERRKKYKTVFDIPGSVTFLPEMPENTNKAWQGAHVLEK